MTWGTPYTGDRIREMVHARLKDPEATVSGDFDTGTITAISKGKKYKISIDAVAVATCEELK